jgi:spore coat polysaccharide biosynthesis protein SpsF
MYKTEQEIFWQGKFGNDYINRNKKKLLIKNNFFFFKKILSKNLKIKSLIEFGPNIGLNIIALKKIFKLNFITGVEINKKACVEMKNIKNINIVNNSIINFSSKIKYDLVLLKGVLIHVNPNKLKRIYKIIYKSCKPSGHILFAEYYNPYPTMMIYRGKRNKLFKRDFAGEFVSLFKKAKIINYGFAYKNDKYPQDDLNWFLIKKNE